MPSAEGFIGTWVLDPSTCNYDLGAPPREGRYSIDWATKGLKVTMRWTDAAGRTLSDSFEASPNGRVYPASSTLVDGLMMQLTDDDVLDTVAYRDDEVFMITRRVLARDRKTMTVVMTGKKVDGTTWENRAVYRRSAG